MWMALTIILTSAAISGRRRIAYRPVGKEFEEFCFGLWCPSMGLHPGQPYLGPRINLLYSQSSRYKFVSSGLKPVCVARARPPPSRRTLALCSDVAQAPEMQDKRVVEVREKVSLCSGFEVNTGICLECPHHHLRHTTVHCSCDQQSIISRCYHCNPRRQCKTCGR